jgi:hypothetical protein
MKAVILMADAASAHPDGTFSLLRGGVTEVNIPRGQPILFRGAFVLRVTGTGAEEGSHRLRIRILSEDGQPVAPDMDGEFVIPRGGGATQVVANFAIVFPRHGRYTFAVTVDGSERETWEMRAQEAATTR